MRPLAALVCAVALCLAAPPARAAVLAPTDLDGLDLGIQVGSARNSDIMTPDLTGQGGPPPQSIGTIVGTVWLKNGIYTYRYDVTPTTDGTRQFISQFHIAGFDPAVHKVGWSYTDAIAAGVSGNPSTAFQIIWNLHNGNAMILNYFVPASQALAGFWSGAHRVPIKFFVQSTHAPDLNVWGLASAQAGIATNYAPSLISATYDGKLRDRVGPANTALGADGAPDGTLTVTLDAPGGRTITRAQLQSSSPGTWDTDSATGAWALGVATTLDGAPVNDPTTMAVSFALGDGASFKLFAADYANLEFVVGATLTVTVAFSDETTTAVFFVVPANSSPNPPSIAVTYDGKLRDRVGAGSVALAPDGAPDGTFTVTLSAAGGRTITEVQLQSSGPGVWDTVAATSFWVLGVASTLDGALLNNATTMAVNFPVADGGSFRLFAADYAGIEFVSGTTLTVTVVFSDGTSAAGTTIAGSTPGPTSLAVTYSGKLRDRVGQSSVALGADGALDGTLAVTLSAAGGRTITRVQLQSTAPGTWDTEAGSPAWVLGVATSLDGALVNNATTMAVNFTVADAGTFYIFAADWQNVEFVPGTTLTVLVVFSDGSSASAATVAGTIAVPPSLAVTYSGKLRDRVGQSSVALAPDGALDGTLTVTLTASGGRTITRVQLQSSAPGTWDTEAGSPAWILGVATSLDGVLVNNATTMAVNFTVTDGGTFYLFAADWSNVEFVPGTTLTVTAVFSDGSSASASTVATATVGPPALAVTFDGKLRDRVGQSSVGLGADGALDGTLTVTLTASGGRTITQLQLQSSAPGSWDTDATTGAWVLGVASTLDGALLNDPATMAVHFTLADGGSFHLFAADFANIEFVPGVTLTITAVFSDGSSARASVTVPPS